MNDKLNEETIETPPRDAATVVLVRDAPTGGIEVLLLKRGNSHTVMNNAYVFPGGKVDEEDTAAEKIATLNLDTKPEQLLNEPDLDPQRAAAMFIAAVRETEEETGVKLQADQLVTLSRWITPKTPSMMRKRFDARFFIARMPSDQIAVHDGEEATDSTWMSPREALLATHNGEITLAPPQIMTLVGIAPHQSVQLCLDYVRSSPTATIEPHVFVHTDKQRILTYPGDPDHPVKDRAMPGPTRLYWKDGMFEPEGGFKTVLPVM